MRAFVAHAEAIYAAPLPRYVINAFDRYLACGDFSRSYRALPLRCVPPRRPRRVLVQRLRRVPELRRPAHVHEAACIPDRVLPNVPVRQWVLSIPFDLRALAATKPDVCTAIGRTFAQVGQRHVHRPRHRDERHRRGIGQRDQVRDHRRRSGDLPPDRHVFRDVERLEVDPWMDEDRPARASLAQGRGDRLGARALLGDDLRHVAEVEARVGRS